MVQKPRMMAVDGCSHIAMYEAVNWFVNEASVRMLAMYVAVHIWQCMRLCIGLYEAMYVPVHMASTRMKHTM